MSPLMWPWTPLNVALRKESVDRNRLMSNVCPPVGRSLSARRAWIEIENPLQEYFVAMVALRKESVDRNSAPVEDLKSNMGRSPQGERG